jgi:F-type H+-transporting ATPase subunit epsilon
MPLTLEIVTPERKVLSETVDHVVLPSEYAGELDILPGHIPLMTTMEPGEIRYYQNGKPESVAVDKGFIRVYGDNVSVLTEAAIEVDKIDVKSLEEAQARAASAVAEAKLTGVDPAVLEELETRARFAVIQKIISDKKRL